MSGIGSVWKQLEVKGQAFVLESLSRELDSKLIAEVLRDTGRQSKRKRKLPADFVVWFVIMLSLYRRVSYANLLEKLIGSWWVHENWGDERPPTTSAVTSARDRLGVEPMRKLFERTSPVWVRHSSPLIFHGHRVKAIDGSTLKTTDSPENRANFGKPGSSRSRAAYPQMRTVLLADIGTRLVTAQEYGSYRTGEIKLARRVLHHVEAGSLMLLDRHFLAYDFLWDLHSCGAEFLVRVPDNIKPRMVKELGPGDAIVEATFPRYYPEKRPDMPRTWILRMVSYCPERGKDTIRLFTTLMDPEISAEEIAGLYHERWEEETIIDEIKTHLCSCHTVNQPVIFRSQTPERVEQEWYGLLLAYNLVRKTMCASALSAQASTRRLSFTAAVERLRETTYDMMRMSVRLLPTRYARMLKQISRAVVPKRPGRNHPRAVKIKMSKYRLKPSAA